MKKVSLHLAAMVAVSFVLLGTQVQNGECFSNATRIADNLLDADEFLMGTETARRVLQQNRPPLNGKAFERKKPFCGDRTRPYDCDDRINKNYKKRVCGLKNLCCRGC
ncbi:hypothetical protein AAHA92_12557 [Salvia divinorum]